MSWFKTPQWRRLDWKILIVLALLSGFSLLFLRSAGYDPFTGEYEAFAKKQIGWIILSGVVLVVMLRVPYRKLLDHAYIFYWGGIALLLLVKVGGTSLNNAKRWLDLKFMMLQPSEFMKVVLIITLARYIRWRDDYKKLTGLIRPFALTLLPVALIISQPDLGTSILFVPVLFALLYVAGANAKHLGIVVLMGLIAMPILFFGFLKDYQQKRILVFIGQSELGEDESLQQNEGYHLHRSRIAVGSGGAAGKGYGKGEQRVPENETDFLFTVIAEEWGFMGSLLVLLLYTALFILILWVAHDCREPSGKLVVIGVFTLLFVQTSVNLGMTIGLAPITGLTLPFLSYGGSSLLAMTLAIGLVLNVKLHPHFVFKRDF